MSDRNDNRYGKGDKPDEEKPLKKPKVKVDAQPQDGRNPSHKKVSEKVREGVKKKVDDAIEKSRDGGYKKQLDAAERAVEEEAQKIDRSTIKKVRVKVEGDIEGADGKKRGVEKTIEKDPCG